LSPDLEKFADKSLISAYAKDSVASVVKEGLIVGNGGRVNPVGNTTLSSYPLSAKQVPLHGFKKTVYL